MIYFSMRYIGNKENLLDKIYQAIQSKNIKGNSFFDFFSGTANVGKYFKKLNYQIYSSDLLYCSYVLQRAYITNNEELHFEKLLSKLNFQSTSLFASPLLIVVEYLNQIEPKIGFIAQNYTPTETQHLEIPKAEMHKDYWKYDKDGEKLGTIFIHLVVEEFTNGFSIFENHAGSEKGYFFAITL